MANFELAVQLEINAPESQRYRRPYVAVWVEDKDGFPIRTIVLWVQSPRGERWIPDLRRWFRSDRMRQYTDKTNLVPTVSSPTRQPGKYNFLWDLTDDQKKDVKPGDYTLYVEAAREHGTYQILKKQITVSDRPFKADLGNNVEIKNASIEYRKKR